MRFVEVSRPERDDDLAVASQRVDSCRDSTLRVRVPEEVARFQPVIPCISTGDDIEQQSDNHSCAADSLESHVKSLRQRGADFIAALDGGDNEERNQCREVLLVTRRRDQAHSAECEGDGESERWTSVRDQHDDAEDHSCADQDQKLRLAQQQHRRSHLLHERIAEGDVTATDLRTSTSRRRIVGESGGRSRCRGASRERNHERADAAERATSPVVPSSRRR